LRSIVVLSILLACVAPAFADGILLQQSVDPTCRLEITRFGVTRTILGYATVRRADNGSVYERNCDFMGAQGSGSYSDIGMPVHYEDAVNMDGIRETRFENARILPNGRIQLR
jgi:hypothetical protein